MHAHATLAMAKAPRAFGAGDFYPTEQKATPTPKPKV